MLILLNRIIHILLSGIPPLGTWIKSIDMKNGFVVSKYKNFRVFFLFNMYEVADKAKIIIITFTGTNTIIVNIIITVTIIISIFITFSIIISLKL
jgi:hypothetical protein